MLCTDTQYEKKRLKTFKKIYIFFFFFFFFFFFYMFLPNPGAAHPFESEGSEDFFFYCQLVCFTQLQHPAWK